MKKIIIISVIIAITACLSTGTLLACEKKLNCWYRGDYDCACSKNSPGSGYVKHKRKCKNVGDCRDQS